MMGRRTGRRFDRNPEQTIQGTVCSGVKRPDMNKE
jgi:hypothetical protein